MRETEIEQAVVDDYDRYSRIKSALKRVRADGFSFVQAKFHPQNQIGNAVVLFEGQGEECRLNVDLNIERTKSFRFRLFCDSFMKRPCYRFESDGSAHENPTSDDCPLPKRSVPTPHFHFYNKRGKCVAYRTEELISSEEKILADVQRALFLFCKEENISLQESPRLVYEQSIFEQNAFADPLEGVTFP